MAHEPQRMTNPSLSPWVYVRRNLRRVLPVLAIQALVTYLLVVTITPTNSFETTGASTLRAFDFFTVVTPQRRATFEDDLMELLDTTPGLERRVEARSFWMRTPMIIGNSYAPLMALTEEVRDEFCKRLGLTLAAGTFPETGSNGVAVHRAVLKARKLTLGDEFGRLVDETHSAPGRFKIVGILDGETRLGIADFAYAARPRFVLSRRPPFQIVYAQPGQLGVCSEHLRHATIEGDAAFRVIDAKFVRKRMDDILRNVPLILGFIVGSVAILVALMTSLLTLISFQLRVDEFGLLLAVGHKRRALIRKLALESGVVALVGWIVGIALGLSTVWLYNRYALEPRGVLMQVVDPRPILLSLAVPLLATGVSAFILARRLRVMDPVSVLQRRGADA